MSYSMSLQSLERAREAMELSPARALKTLPAAAALPAFLRPERNFIGAEAWRAMGYFDRAEKLYTKVLTAKTMGDDPALWIEAALGCASGLRSVGAVAKAGALIRGARSLSRSQGLTVYGDRLDLEYALIDRAAGKYGDSLKALRGFLTKSLRRADYGEAAFLLWAIGGAQRFSGRLRDAHRSFLKSRSLARQARDRVGEGYALFGLGGITRILGRLEECARFYAAAGKVFAKTDDHFAQAYALCGYANSLRQLGRLREAESFYRRSHRLYSRIGDKVDLAYVDWGLGRVRFLAGDVKAARPYFRKALAAFRKYGEDRGEVLAAVSLAEALHVLGKTKDAEVLFARAYRLSLNAGLHAHIEPFT